MSCRAALQWIGILSISLLPVVAQEPATPGKLNLVIVEGEGAINNIRQRTSRETIVQVQDENHKPIAGAAVVFLLPNDGPGGVFASGSKSASVVTDASGRATMPRITPNNNAGQFQIRVHASYRGQEADATVTQSIVAGAPVAPAHTGISGKAIAIIVGVAAAGAVGVAVGLSGGKTNPPSPPQTTTPTGTISLGSGATLGPPQ